MTDDHAEDLDLALELADLADAVSLAHFRAVDLDVQTKPDRTPVTEADLAVERTIRDRLAETRPGDGILGEEFGTEGDSTRQWSRARKQRLAKRQPGGGSIAVGTSPRSLMRCDTVRWSAGTEDSRACV